MAVQEAVAGMGELLEKIEIHRKKSAIFVLFCGEKDAAGISWCPDCVDAEPVVRSSLNSAPEDAVFIYCTVGDRTAWKNPDNEFRKNEKTKLTSVPTLLKWGTPQRLGEEDCKKSDLVKMLFEED